MIETAQNAVGATLAAGAGEAEAYFSEDARREVRVHGGETESLTAATQRGVGIRAWIGGKVGYAFGTDLSKRGLAAIGGRAAEAARLADEDEFAAPPELPVRLMPDMDAQVAPELSDASVAAWSTGDVSELALAVEEAALAADGRVAGVEQAVYADSAERIAIASSAGIEGEYERSSCYAYVQALAESEEGRETGLGFDLGRGPASLDPLAIGREGAERATAMIGAEKPRSRSCPVLLDPTVAASFVGLIGRALSAATVQRGRSPFADRLGSEVAATAFVLHDDGLDPDGPATSPFDAEGVPRRRTALIEDRALRSYLHDTYSARRGAAASTGNAGRSGYRAQPGVAPSNLLVAAGTHSFEDLLSTADDGVFVTDVAGLHSGVNPVTGVFSVGASGRRILAGELAEPLREFTIAGDLIAMLEAVQVVGAEPRWVPFGGSVSTPPLLIGSMAVAGS